MSGARSKIRPQLGSRQGGARPPLRRTVEKIPDTTFAFLSAAPSLVKLATRGQAFCLSWKAA